MSSTLPIESCEHCGTRTHPVEGERRSGPSGHHALPGRSRRVDAHQQPRRVPPPGRPDRPRTRPRPDQPRGPLPAHSRVPTPGGVMSCVIRAACLGQDPDVLYCEQCVSLIVTELRAVPGVLGLLASEMPKTLSRPPSPTPAQAGGSVRPHPCGNTWWTSGPSLWTRSPSGPPSPDARRRVPRTGSPKRANVWSLTRTDTSPPLEPSKGREPSKPERGNGQVVR